MMSKRTHGGVDAVFDKELPMLWACLALVALAVVPYVQVVGFDFVYDDAIYITKNQTVRVGLTGDGIVRAFTEPGVGNWHPLTLLSHMLDCDLFGLKNPAGHHAVNVLLHAANSVLLFVLLRWITGAFWPCAAAAALFASHPLRVESVAWVAERKDVLSGFFWMLTMLAYGWYTKRPAPGRYLLVLAAYAFGLMSKPMVVTLPCALLLLDVWPLGRCRQAQKHIRYRLVLEKLPLLVMSVLSSVVTVVVQNQAGVPKLRFAENLSFGWRVANSLVAYVNYLRKTIWPSDLACFYPHPAIIWSHAAGRWAAAAIGAGVLLALVSFLVLRLVHRRPYLFVGWFWYLGTLVPVIGLVQVGEQAMADRYTYLPSVGVCILLVWSMRDLTAHWPRRNTILATAMGVVLAACVATTWMQAQHWRSNLSLFGHALTVTKRNYIAHINYGNALLGQEYFNKATHHYRRALAIKSDYALAHYNLGLAYHKQEKYGPAMESYERALQIQPGYVEAHINLAILFEKQHNLRQAEHHYELGLRSDPRHAQAHYNLGAIRASQGDLDRAIFHFRASLASKRSQWRAANSLAWVLATSPNEKLRHGAEAVSWAEHAVQAGGEKKPGVLATLSAAYAEVGRFGDAVQTATKALEMARERDQVELAHEIEKYLRLFESGRPYHGP